MTRVDRKVWATATYPEIAMPVYFFDPQLNDHDDVTWLAETLGPGENIQLVEKHPGGYEVWDTFATFDRRVPPWQADRLDAAQVAWLLTDPQRGLNSRGIYVVPNRLPSLARDIAIFSYMAHLPGASMDALKPARPQRAKTQAPLPIYIYGDPVLDRIDLDLLSHAIGRRRQMVLVEKVDDGYRMWLSRTDDPLSKSRPLANGRVLAPAQVAWELVNPANAWAERDKYLVPSCFAGLEVDASIISYLARLPGMSTLATRTGEDKFKVDRLRYAHDMSSFLGHNHGYQYSEEGIIEAVVEYESAFLKARRETHSNETVVRVEAPNGKLSGTARRRIRWHVESQQQRSPSWETLVVPAVSGQEYGVLAFLSIGDHGVVKADLIVSDTKVAHAITGTGYAKEGLHKSDPSDEERHRVHPLIVEDTITMAQLFEELVDPGTDHGIVRVIVNRDLIVALGDNNFDDDTVVDLDWNNRPGWLMWIIPAAQLGMDLPDFMKLVHRWKQGEDIKFEPQGPERAAIIRPFVPAGGSPAFRLNNDEGVRWFKKNGMTGFVATPITRKTGFVPEMRTGKDNNHRPIIGVMAATYEEAEQFWFELAAQQGALWQEDGTLSGYTPNAYVPAEGAASTHYIDHTRFDEYLSLQPKALPPGPSSIGL